MKSEDLFLAIGEVEGSRLARSELALNEPSGAAPKEGANVNKTKITIARILRNALIAALTVSMLGVTAYAVTGYLIFDSPSQMLTSLFGDNTGYDHKGVTLIENPGKPEDPIENPAYDRVPADEELVASEAAPLVDAVGQSISWKGYTLTVDANLYDKVTKCGVLTYTIENPDGLKPYELQPSGEVWFPDGEIVRTNQYGYSYIIQDQSSETKLTAAYYYQLRNPQSSDLELTFTEWAVISPSESNRIIDELVEQTKQEMTLEEAMEILKADISEEEYESYVAGMTQEQLEYAAYFQPAYEKYETLYTCPDKITIPEQALGEMSSVILADGEIIVSPIAMYVDISNRKDYPNEFNSVAKIRFQDGTEYVVQDENTANYVFAVGGSDKDVTYMFNRMIDVNEITAVILDGGLEFRVN